MAATAVYLLLIITFADHSPSFATKFLVQGGLHQCFMAAGAFMTVPPHKEMNGHVVHAYSATCSVEVQDKPT